MSPRGSGGCRTRRCRPWWPDGPRRSTRSGRWHWALRPSIVSRTSSAPISRMISAAPSCVEGQDGSMARDIIMAAGGIVVQRGDVPLFAVVCLRKRGEWVLPKGKLDAGETPRDAALREVLEETGHGAA